VKAHIADSPEKERGFTMKGKKTFCVGSLALCLALILGGGVAAYGQTVYGSLAGTVFDPSGAVIPQASVTIRSLDTGQAREIKADDSGFWRMPSLPPGRYAVDVVAPNFGKLQYCSLKPFLCYSVWGREAPEWPVPLQPCPPGAALPITSASA
jgi:hypothetical protein